MDVITIAIPADVFYLGLFTAGLLAGAALARWAYRATPGRVRVPYMRPPVPPEPGRGYLTPRNAYNANPPPDYPRPPVPSAPPPRHP